MTLNLTHLLAFHAAAETLNVSKAAEKLLVSQPAISKQIRLLENHLGAQLFLRRPKGLRLTEAGRVLDGYARTIFTSADEAERALLDVNAVRRGRLAIGASTTIATYLLPEVFVAFRRSYPGVQATIDVAGSVHVCRRVTDGDLDVGLVEVAPPQNTVDEAIFYSDELTGIVHPAHALATRGRASIRAFCREPFVVRDTASETKSFVERVLAQRNIALEPVMSLSSTEAIKRAVAAGIGVAIVSKLSIALEVQAKVLVPVVLTDLRICRPLYRVTARGSRASGALQAFLGALAAFCNQPAISGKRSFKSK